MRRALAIISVAFGCSAAEAQSLVSEKGWEAWSQVRYIGGDAKQTELNRKARTGAPYSMLVLTDTTIELHACLSRLCDDDPKRGTPFAVQSLYTIPLAAIRHVDQWIEPSAGVNYSPDQFGFVYETATGVEAPAFAISSWADARMILAKVRFRMKKLGLELPAK